MPKHRSRSWRRREAIEQGLQPNSNTGDRIAKEWLEKSARVMGREPDADHKMWLHRTYREHDPRAARYWELVAILRGEAPDRRPNREWTWIVEAMKHHPAD
jgi:citrate synthase